MSAAPEIARAGAAPAAPLCPAGTPAQAKTPALARRLALRIGTRWLPRAAWTLSRTGRPGLVGLALLLAAALFLFSTHLEVAAEVQALRKDLAAAQSRARTTVTDEVADPATAVRALPARSDMPAILRQLFNHATQARLAVDTAKYEINATGSGAVIRLQITFPVVGPYPHVRAFIDTTLATMPAIALSDLVLDRKSIADGRVEAQIRLTVYTVGTGTAGLPEDGAAPVYAVATGTIGAPGDGSAPAPPARQTSRAASQLASAQAQRAETPRASKARPESKRVVASTREAALFAQHSWYVLPPPPKPVPPPPPPAPTAPAFPYTLMGSFSPEGQPPVFFLARGDHVIDAHVGDRIDGVYQFESAAGGQLVFVYLPLDVRQTLAVGASQ